MFSFLRVTFCAIGAAALILSLSLYSQADQPSLSADCASSPYSLDCQCVVDGFNKVTTGLNGPQKQLASKYLRAMIGIQDTTFIENEQAMAMEVFSKTAEFNMSVAETCKATGTGADANSAEQRSLIMGICEQSRHYMDCGCVTDRYAKAANDLPAEGQELARAMIAARLNVSITPSMDEISPAVMMQNSSAMSDLEGLAESCAIVPQSAISAYETVGKTPAPTMEARASASGADSMRMWCEAVDGRSPAYCACQVEVIRDLVPEKEFQFNAESMKSLALVELGRLDGPDRFKHAAAALGYDTDDKTVSALHATTGDAIQKAYAISYEVCDAVEQDAHK